MFVAASSVASSDYVNAAISKVNIFIGLAPVAYVGNMQSDILVKMAHTNLAQVCVFTVYFLYYNIMLEEGRQGGV